MARKDKRVLIPTSPHRPRWLLIAILLLIVIGDFLLPDLVLATGLSTFAVGVAGLAYSLLGAPALFLLGRRLRRRWQDQPATRSDFLIIVVPASMSLSTQNGLVGFLADLLLLLPPLAGLWFGLGLHRQAP